jgi:ubiquinone/menaquinone biosynthesis C-methylase UbiE
MSREHKPYAGGSIPENYERYLVPLLFMDYAADLAACLDVPADGAVLETACGTGAVTRQLRARLRDSVRLTVTDFALPMVEQVQRIVGDHPGIEYRQADATDLPFAAESFDAVICQFSLMLFPDKAKAMREAARVLRSGGCFVFNVWDRLERNGFSRAVHEAVSELYRSDPPRFLEAPYSYHDLSVITDSLQQAGFDTIEIVVQPRDSKASDPHQVAAGLVAGSPLAMQVVERDTLSLEEATLAVEDVIAREFGSGPISAPMQAFRICAHLEG